MIEVKRVRSGQKQTTKNPWSRKGIKHSAIEFEVKAYLREGQFSGVCQCGCGGATEIADRTSRNRDGSLFTAKGYPRNLIKGHGANTQKGERNSGFKGERLIGKGGYVYIFMPDHPRAVKGRVLEHLLVAEEMLGRPLKYYGHNRRDNEVVHHKDKDTTNNSKDNLEIMSNQEHSRLHRILEGRTKIGCHAKGYNKFTRAQVLKALKMNREGVKTAKIAEMLGMSRVTVHSYLTGKTPIPSV